MVKIKIMEVEQMKTKKIKIFALLLFALMLTVVFCACTISIGNGKKTNSSDDNNNSTPAGNDIAPDSGELTIEVLKKAAQDLGYDVRDDFMTGFSATIEPKAGFTATYISMGVYDIPFFEFKDNDEALAYKAENDEPDAMFPKEHIVIGRFAAECTSLSEESGAECKKFIEDVFEKARG